jgi:hypothetical protein
MATLQDMGRMRHLPIAAVAALALASPASAAAWAPADSASIKPGNQTITDGTAQCTSNFVFTAGSTIYLGQAAHCASTGEATDINGCVTHTKPIGTPVEIQGATRPGRLAYSSWVSMQGRHEGDPNTCQFNDFALVAIDPADYGRVNPSVPGFGGPTGVGTAAVGSTIFSYGNSSLRLGLTLLSPKQGLVLLSEGGGWSSTVFTVTPGIPGDSGSGMMNENGQAVGVLSTLAILPLPATNGVGDLTRSLNWMRSHEPGFAGVNLATGTQPFRANLVQAILGAI